MTGRIIGCSCSRVNPLQDYVVASREATEYSAKGKRGHHSEPPPVPGRRPFPDPAPPSSPPPPGANEPSDLPRQFLWRVRLLTRGTIDGQRRRLKHCVFEPIAPCTVGGPMRAVVQFDHQQRCRGGRVAKHKIDVKTLDVPKAASRIRAPIACIAAGDGPIHLILQLSQTSAKCAFSARNP